jgi:hypothetical protein
MIGSSALALCATLSARFRLLIISRQEFPPSPSRRFGGVADGDVYPAVLALSGRECGDVPLIAVSAGSCSADRAAGSAARAELA